jgi:xylulokinase
VSILGIDLGTGSVKAAVVDDEFGVRARAAQKYAVTAPRPGWAESDPHDWLAATRAVVSEASAGEVVTSVGFSGQMHGVVVADDELRPLRPAILWADGRSAEQARRLAADLPPVALSRLGSPAVPGFAATTLAWLVEHEPEIMAAASFALQPKDWLRAVLGGDIATDPSDASGTLLFDVVSGSWSDESIAWAGIDPALLPRVRGSQDSAGVVVLDGREVPCATGGADTACALAGLGLGPGSGFVAVGSGAQVVRVMDEPRVDSSLRTHTFASAGSVGQGWYRIGAVQSAGLALTAALSWFAASVEEAAAALAAGVREDDPVFVPYLSGERTPFMESRLRGAWHRLSLATDRPALLRSVLEGVAQAVALGVAAVQESGEALPDVVPLVGGGTHDPAFRQLLADASGLKLAVTDAPDAAVVGAALLGAGQTVNPRPAARTDVVVPVPSSVTLLRDRREAMVQWVVVDELA